MRGSAVTTTPRVAEVAMWLSVTLAVSLLFGEHDPTLLGFYAFGGGAALWFAARHQQQRNEDFAIGRMTRDERVAVDRAVATGVAPSDPVLHAAAINLARVRLAETAGGNPRLAMLMVFLLLLVSVFYMVTDPSLEHVFSSVMFGLTLALVAAEPAWRRRRVGQLEQTIDQLARPAYP